jgi:hypothetical protein
MMQLIQITRGYVLRILIVAGKTTTSFIAAKESNAWRSHLRGLRTLLPPDHNIKTKSLNLKSQVHGRRGKMIAGPTHRAWLLRIPVALIYYLKFSISTPFDRAGDDVALSAIFSPIHKPEVRDDRLEGFGHLSSQTTSIQKVGVSSDVLNHMAEKSNPRYNGLDLEGDQ